ncbi:hypothetical protein Pcinc_017999 [Petrolisthes cinctipes]|uniref:NACHT domain-containing protein n=1 Tax=Petrolisthes cinctipes TaxID=88211 RepID=A0AAE1FN51_PETCI|nr:hypothetical protein Pcinc_017999 [Petrolisthes cinctipes]
MNMLTGASGGFCEENLNFLRVFKAVASEGCAAMLQVFKWGCKKSKSKTLEDYLLMVKKMPEKLLKKLFNKTSRDKIRTDPECDSFDISLLLLAIKVACDGVAHKDSDEWHTEDKEKLEYNLTLLKNKRNEVAHNVRPLKKDEMKKNIEELRCLIVQIINLASTRFGISCTEKDKIISELNDSLNRTRDQHLLEAEIVEYRKKIDIEHALYIIKSKGPEELREKYKCLTVINPVSFIDGYDMRVEVDAIYSKIKIIKSGRHSTGDVIEIDDLLLVNDSDACEFPQSKRKMIVIDGCSGAGKTTLTKLLVSEWLKSSLVIKGLLDIDLIFLMECRNAGIEKLSELIEILMPNTSAMTENNIVKCVHNLRLLFIVDGLDELNKASQKLFSEILEISRTGDHTVFCTSRPQKLKDLFKMVPEELGVEHLQITGIPMEQRSDFARKYHDQMILLGKSKQSSEELVEFLEKSPAKLKEFYRFPINLVLLTYLWAEKADVKNIKTTTELYHQIHDMLIQKLLQRLKHLDSTRHIPVTELETKVQEFLFEIFRQALLTLKDDEVILNPKTLEKLRTFASDLALSAREVLSAFLVVKVVWTRSGSEEQISFPHKDMHDFFAANCLYHAISDNEYCKTLMESYLDSSPSKSWWEKLRAPKQSGVIHDVLKVVLQGSVDLNKLAKFQNVFKHLAGLLYAKDDSVKDEECEELVKLFCESGISDRDQWLDLLGTVKWNKRTARYIATNIFDDKLLVKDARIPEYLSLLPYANLKKVMIEIMSDPDDLPDLMKLLTEVAQHNCIVSLYLMHHYRNPEKEKTSDKFLNCLLDDDAQCDVRVVVGNLSGSPIPKLDGFSHVSTAVCDNSHAQALRNLFLSKCVRVKGFHVQPDVMPAAVCSIPCDYFDEVFLFFSHITDEQVEWASNIAKALTCSSGFQSIRFPASELSLNGCIDLINKMVERKVKITGSGILGGGLWIDSPHLSKENRKKLDPALSTLKCRLRRKTITTNWERNDIWTGVVSNTLSMH